MPIWLTLVDRLIDRNLLQIAGVGDATAVYAVLVASFCSEAFAQTGRLTVTVCYSPEVQRWDLERYLGAALKWRVFRGDVAPDDVIMAMSIPDDDETEQPAAGAAAALEEPDSPNELKFDLGITRRPRGRIRLSQHSRRGPGSDPFALFSKSSPS